MNAFILSIGDELALGQTVDTNSAWLSQQLAAVGVDVRGHLTVPDDQPAIENAIRLAVGRHDFLLISGGIGPTEDDLTRQALAAYMRTKLELNEACLATLVEFFKSRGREMPDINKVQALIPHGAKPIENTAGTAPGIEASLKRTIVFSDEPAVNAVSDEYLEQMFGEEEIIRRKKVQQSMQIAVEQTRETLNKLGLDRVTRTFVMPGVPKEMKQMFTRSILPIISESSAGATILSRTLHTFGLGESAIAEKLGPLMKRDRNPSVGTTVSNNIVSLRANARFPNREETQAQLDATTTACRDALGDLIFGQDDETLPSVLAPMLLSVRASVTTAESCTGGLLAKYLTDIPGSSAYFKQSWVVYSNEAKHDRLGVPTEVLNLYGAVSEHVVEHLAKNARRLARATYALSISGIAGPDGGTPTKPVGTVCICLAFRPAAAPTPSPDAPGEGRSEGDFDAAPTRPPRDDFMTSAFLTRTFIFTGDREMIRDRAAKMALTLLRFHLLNKALPF